jgi:tetratricopeptide (TPR) repeat protein
MSLNKLSFAYEQNDAPDAALKSVQRAIDLTTEQNGGTGVAHGLAGLHFAKGRVYSKLKEKYKAIDCLNEALKIYPAYVKALKLKSMIGAETRQLSVQIEAREGLAHALTVYSEVGSEYFQLAKLHLDNRNYKRARFCIDEALSRFPDKPDYIRFRDDLKRIRRGSRSRSRSRSPTPRYRRNRRSHSRSYSHDRSASASPKRRARHTPKRPSSPKFHAWKSFRGGKYRSRSRSPTANRRSSLVSKETQKFIPTHGAKVKLEQMHQIAAVSGDARTVPSIGTKPRSAAAAWAVATKPSPSTELELVPAVPPIATPRASVPAPAAAAPKPVTAPKPIAAIKPVDLITKGAEKTVEVSAAAFRKFDAPAFANWIVNIGKAYENYGPPVIA